MTSTAPADYCNHCGNDPTKHKGQWVCPYCSREYDNRSAFQLRMASAAPYLSLIAVWLLPGALAVFIGRTTWDLTWADTWVFAACAIGFMFVGIGSAGVQAWFLGSHEGVRRRDKSLGNVLLEGQPFIFCAPWALASVLAAALVVEFNYLD